MGAPALEIRDVSKRFGPRWAVARLSYRLEEGKALLLTGHNGSGKTTLVRMISTATFPTAGEIVIFGKETRACRTALRHDVALLSHASYVYDDLTAEQNLVLVCRLLGLDKPHRRVGEMLERVGLAGRAQSPVRTFSAGMRKRVAIGRLLLKQPRLALFDEPFGELDPAGIIQMEGLIRDLQKTGATIVLATHYVQQGLNLTGDRLHLENGRHVLPSEAVLT